VAVNAPILFAAGETLGRYAYDVVTAAGAAYDLTGCAAHLSARTTGATPAALVDWTSAAGTLTIAAAAGTITIPMSAATSAALAPGYYYYDLTVTYADATREVLYAGTFQVQQGFARYP